MHFKFQIFLLFTLALAAGCNHARPEASLVVYNVQVGNRMDQVRDWTGTADVLKKLNAESVVITEAYVSSATAGQTINHPRLLGEIAQYNSEFGMAATLPDGEYGNAVLSKYPLERIALLNLPSADTPRSALIVKVLAEQPYYVVATHFCCDEKNEHIRAICIKLIYDYITEHNLIPAIVMGDFNTAPDSATMTVARNLGFKVLNDTAPAELSYPADNPQELLDYQLLYPADAAQIISHYVAEEPLASDHRPVYSKIVFK